MTLSLTNEHLTVTFKDLGGELSSIKDTDGVEYLWQGDSKYWSGQAPVLFPICGSLRDNQTYYSDNSLGLEKGSMPRHGLVRKEVFKGQKLSKTQAFYTLTSNDTMYHQYPYRFELGILYTLIDSSIKVTYCIKNLEENFEMPFTVGGHPAFNCPLYENESYEDYYLEFSEPEEGTSAKVIAETGLVNVAKRQHFLNGKHRLELDYSLFKDDTILLDQLVSKSVSLKSKNHNKGLTLNLLDFPYLILWSTANRGPFVALEPWLGISTSETENDNFDEKQNMQFLEPYILNQKVTHYSYEISIKKL
ncbi:protein lacX [Streptococcus bovimastitidis]|uniref:Protein lacX n=1 Tax=Streptococcus bovimastitidis TaxID=1856638 RepID=A0A1L8ML98_9STRE|nr:aldose 1-epimerase family protein [Streptococcus bovimastitidis]OJF71537.1 protein lacX [Streptococcus bovimastitidis]